MQPQILSVGFNTESSFCWLLQTFKHISRLVHLEKSPQLSHLQLPEHLTWCHDSSGTERLANRTGMGGGEGRINYPYTFGVNITLGQGLLPSLGKGWVFGSIQPFHPKPLPRINACPQCWVCESTSVPPPQPVSPQRPQYCPLQQRDNF